MHRRTPRSIMHPSLVFQRRVEFCETDAAGIVHFSAFFQYMEQAEHALLRHLGLSVLMHDEEGTISWPRVNVHCDFLDAVKFEHLLEVAVRVDQPPQAIPIPVWIADRLRTYTTT
jgi:acyl-CoA thioester hydrolase